MISRERIGHWMKRSMGLVAQPGYVWEEIFAEDYTSPELYKRYIIPFAILISLLTFGINLLQDSAWFAVRYALCDFVSITAGICLASLAVKEYLINKAKNYRYISLVLCTYCAVVFIFFNSISSAVHSVFISQLFGLSSLVFLHTLYSGIQHLPEYPKDKKSNLLIITAICVTCIPFIIKKLLMIILHVPAFNL